MKTTKMVIACLVIFLYADISFAFGPYQGNYRWRNDDGDVYSATWKDSVNTPFILTDYENIRLRIENLYSDPFSDTISISLYYTEDGLWIPITDVDTGKFFISPSQYLSDTMSYFNNQLLPPSSIYPYVRTITFDLTNNYFMITDDSSAYELEYSLKPTMNIQPGSAYFFSLCIDSIPMNLWGAENEYAVLLTSPLNWITQSSGTTINLSGVSFTDANNGTAVGGFGTIIRTTDGGNNWVSQTSGTYERLYGVSFTDENNGTAVGVVGTILRTTDGGTTWTSQSSGTTESLYDVSFTDTNNGTAVGGNGTILKTTNGGTTWTLQSSGTTESLYDVSFTDANNGTAVGYFGTILRTTNGGTNWTSQSSGTTESLYDVSFTDANNGTAVGRNGTILRTTNGGTTWTQQSSGTTQQLRSVHFTDNNTGWAVGYFGCILKTIDGGLSWIKLTSGSTRYFESVQFVDNETGWVVGDWGRILKTTNGGVTFAEEEEIDEIPTEYYLSQNYPNPFNPNTKIRYSVSQYSNVVIKVFDILGNEIETLVNEEKLIGTYEVTWYAEKLSSGVYFYQLRAGDYFDTKKMILLK